jgi:steroid delta-isomerase-like uncharacterized protein
MTQQTVADVAKAPIVAFNAKDWDATRKALSSDVRYDEVATHREAGGVNDVLTVWRSWASAFPDVQGTFESVHVAGSTVVLEIIWRGTHTATLRAGAGEIPPTGRQIEIKACQIVEVADGTVLRVRQYFDMATMMQQLGLATAGV